NAASLSSALTRAGFAAAQLLPPQLDAAFDIEQSTAMAEGRDPYQDDRARRRAARREGKALDRAALADPVHAESITLIAFKRCAAVLVAAPHRSAGRRPRDKRAGRCCERSRRVDRAPCGDGRWTRAETLRDREAARCAHEASAAAHR